MNLRMPFQELGLTEDITNKLAEMDIVMPTTVQAKAIPAVLKGLNLLIQSPTGTGKTLAYLAPLADKLDLSSKELQVIILVPSRELATQVVGVAKSFSAGIRVATLIGGANLTRQLEALKQKPLLAVGTPGRVLELIQKKKINGQSIKTIVIDEADKMFSAGFLEDVRGILKATLKTRQVLFISATLPKQLQETVSGLIPSAQFINAGEEGRVPPTITHIYFMCSKEQKIRTLARLIKLYKPNKALVFIQRNEGVASLEKRLKDLGVEAVGLHSDLPSQLRRGLLEKFRLGRCSILITTDLLARGMDFEEVDYIFNYDLPIDEKHYLHRAGRTGRAGQPGTAVTLVAENQKNIIPKLARTLRIKFTQMGLSEKGIFPVAYSGKIKTREEKLHNKSYKKKG